MAEDIFGNEINEDLSDILRSDCVGCWVLIYKDGNGYPIEGDFEKLFNYQGVVLGRQDDDYLIQLFKQDSGAESNIIKLPVSEVPGPRVRVYATRDTWAERINTEWKWWRAKKEEEAHGKRPVKVLSMADLLDMEPEEGAAE